MRRYPSTIGILIGTLFACLVSFFPFTQSRAEQQCTQIITTVAGNGQRGFSGDEGPAINAKLNLPYGVAVDAQENIYIADHSNNRIRKVTRDGIIHTVAGNGGPGSSGDEDSAINASFSYPEGIAVDAQGNIYIVAAGNNQIRKITPDGIIHTVAGTGRVGFSGDGGPAINAQLFFPYGVAVDAQGNIYIASEFESRIRKVTPDGIITSVAGISGGMHVGDTGPADNYEFYFIGGVAADAQENIYVSIVEDSKILKVTRDGTITTIAGVGGPGYGVPLGDEGPAIDAKLNLPGGVAVDAQGNIYIADQRSYRIRKITPDGLIHTVAGNGQQGFSGDGGPPVNAELVHPYGVAVDAQGSIYIADEGNNRIRKVSSSCMHLGCQDKQCKFVPGAGKDECSNKDLISSLKSCVPTVKRKPTKFHPVPIPPKLPMPLK